MKINKVYDANVYVNNASTHGQASEVTPPTITAKMTEYAALGMVGTAEFFNGVEAMEATIKWTYPDNNIKMACSNFIKPVDLMVRSSKVEIDNQGQEEIPVVIYLRGYPKEINGDSFKKGEDSAPETSFMVNYYKEEIDGEEILEIDVLNNIYKVNGKDLMTERRQNLGI